MRSTETVEAFKVSDHDEAISRTESHLAVTNLGEKFVYEGVDAAHLSTTDFE